MDYILIKKYARARTFKSIFLLVRKRAHTCTCIHLHSHSHHTHTAPIYTYVGLYSHSAQSCTHVYALTRAYINTYKCAEIYVHIYVHIHACTTHKFMQS